MARRPKHDVQVDPFNAGEPTLPWENSDTFDLFDRGEGEGEECAFGDEPYNSPTKTPDNYDAPGADDPDPAIPSAPGAPARGISVRQRKKLGMSASKAKRPGKKSRVASALKTIAILVLLVNLAPIALGIASRVFDGADSLFEPDEPTAPEYSGPDFMSDADAEQAEKACVEAVDEGIALMLADTSTARAELAERISGLYGEYTGLGTVELGIDARAFADWLLDNFRYEVDACYAFDDGTASLYFNTWGPSAAAIVNESSGDIYERLWEEGAGDTGNASLTPEQQEQVRELHAQAVSEASLDEEGYAAIDLRLEDGAWRFDTDALFDEVANALGVW